MSQVLVVDDAETVAEVTVHVRRPREQVESDPASPTHVQTARGIDRLEAPCI